MTGALNEDVRRYWEAEPCGTGAPELAVLEPGSLAWFLELERNLAERGRRSNLQRVDAEVLPFEPSSFDVVYSWGVIHHAEAPERIVAEIARILRPGGVFLGMLYARRSLVAYRKWFGNALKAGRPGRSLAAVIWDHMESRGTKAYTETEVRRLFAAFARCRTTRFLTPYDTEALPAWVTTFLPAALGWNIAVEATR